MIVAFGGAIGRWQRIDSDENLCHTVKHAAAGGSLSPSAAPILAERLETLAAARPPSSAASR